MEYRKKKIGSKRRRQTWELVFLQFNWIKHAFPISKLLSLRVCARAQLSACRDRRSRNITKKIEREQKMNRFVVYYRTRKIILVFFFSLVLVVLLSVRHFLISSMVINIWQMQSMRNMQKQEMRWTTGVWENFRRHNLRTQVKHETTPKKKHINEKNKPINKQNERQQRNEEMFASFSSYFTFRSHSFYGQMV